MGVLEAELQSSQLTKEGYLGITVALSGDSLACSAPAEDVGAVEEAGAVYVFDHVGSGWIERARLVSSAPAMGDDFGLGLAFDLDTVAVGAPFADQRASADGNVTVFVRNGSSFVEEAVLGQPTGQNGAAFGWALSLEGDRLAVGAPYYDNGAGPGSGAVFVFARSAGVWTQDATLIPTDPAAQDWFGYALDIDGTSVLVGAYGQGSDQGAAYVFLRGAAGWSQQAKLVEVPSLAQRQFGFAVALEGNQAFVGAPGSALQNQLPGSVHLFLRTGTVWSELLELAASNGEAYDFFGGAIDFLGARAVITARDSGQAYMFSGIGPTWVERLAVTTEELGAERFEGVAVEGDTWILGSPYDDVAGKADAGLARALFITGGVDPSLGSYCTPGVSASGCQAVLSACGTPSASASGGFAVIASDVEGSKDGLFFFGTSGQQANSWGNGTSLQCVVPPVVRGPVVASGGTSGLCDGEAIQDMNALWCPVGCPAPLKAPGVGEEVQMQFWYRDPNNTSNQVTSMSDALQFVMAP